jgi:hypothetical protein
MVCTKSLSVAITLFDMPEDDVKDVLYCHDAVAQYGLGKMDSINTCTLNHEQYVRVLYSFPALNGERKLELNRRPDDNFTR